MKKQTIYTKEELINKLKEIAEMGWIPNARSGNHGGIGNTLEDKLEIVENNLPIPNAAEWELKARRLKSASLVTLSYWSFDDLEHKAGTKLLNTFYVQAEVKIERKKEYYHYMNVMMLQKFSFDEFLKALEEGKILIDFDARTGHNHGTKFRMKQDCLPMLYKNKKILL